MDEDLTIITFNLVGVRFDYTTLGERKRRLSIYTACQHDNTVYHNHYILGEFGPNFDFFTGAIKVLGRIQNGMKNITMHVGLDECRTLISKYTA